MQEQGLATPYRRPRRRRQAQLGPGRYDEGRQRPRARTHGTGAGVRSAGQHRLTLADEDNEFLPAEGVTPDGGYDDGRTFAPTAPTFAPSARPSRWRAREEGGSLGTKLPTVAIVGSYEVFEFKHVRLQEALQRRILQVPWCRYPVALGGDYNKYRSQVGRNQRELQLQDANGARVSPGEPGGLQTEEASPRPTE